MIKYEDVKTVTTQEFFKNNIFGLDVFEKRYKLNDTETVVQMFKRVCDYIASVEKTEELKVYWSERWFDEIYNGWWLPAGSILQGAASGRNISLANCSTLSFGHHSEEDWDNLESIFKNVAYTTAKMAAYRQGLGIDFSTLRPKSMTVDNSAKLSTGAVSWMSFIDKIGYYIGQFGRIPAFLFSLSCDHPDIEEFITVKSDYTKIQNANISVQCSDKFYEAVEQDLDWQLYFEIPSIKKGDKIYLDVHSIDMNCLKDEKGYYKIAKKDKEKQVFTKIVKAKYILELIAKNMALHAEPGIQNIDIAKKYSNSDYVYDANNLYNSKICSTNACCLVGKTQVLCATGYYKIIDLVGTEVEVWNGKEFSTVIPFLAAKNMPTYRVKLSNGKYLDCTGNHKWLIDINGKESRVETDNLEIGMRLYNYNFPVIKSGYVNSDVTHAYKQGIFSGDGQYNNNSKGVLLYGEKQKLAPYLTDKKDLHILKGDRIWITLPQTLHDKTYVPLNENLSYKLKWLAGLLDSDGCVVTNKSGSISLQISNIDFDFIQNVELLLTTLGCYGHINTLKKECFTLLPDGKGNSKNYFCRTCYRLCISGYNVEKLITLGLKTYRLNLENRKVPSYKVKKKITVVSIDFLDNQDVYCFTEEKNHSGCFNGIVTGQSEQYLSRESLCVLGSINCEKFSIEKSIYDKELEKIAESITRFLDNVNECELVYETYATPHQKLAIESLRRIGAGCTNIAAWLFKNNVEYGTSIGNTLFEDFIKTYNYYLYKASINLGKEKGNFGLFVKEKYEKSPFIQRMKSLGLDFISMRNVTCSSIAPTGSISTQFKDHVMSYGIEPAFGLYYWKRTRISGKYEYYFCIPNIVRRIFAEKNISLPISSDTIKDTWDGINGKPIAYLIDSNKERLGFKFKNATEVQPDEKLDFMAGVMKWVDSSISTTYLLPEKNNWQDVYNFILKAHKKEVKSIAAFPDKKLYGIVSFIPFKDLAFKLKAENVEMHAQNFTDEELQILNLSRTEVITQLVNAPKRLKTLEADIYTVSVKGEKFIVAVGLQNGIPYEVFSGKQNSLSILKTPTKGFVSKIKSGHYSLQIGEVVIDNFADLFTPIEKALIRMVSTMLRHGVPIHYIIEQLQKSSDDMLSIVSAIARVLKKYIKDGQKITGHSCPLCKNSNLAYIEGCVTCINCSWSKCQ